MSPQTKETSVTRHLKRTSERQFQVIDADGTVKGAVWREGTAADTDKRWRASTPDAMSEWRPWRFYATPQDAAEACIAAYDRAYPQVTS
jgi:hypothetical protein